MIDLKDLGDVASEASVRRARNGAFGGKWSISECIKHMAEEVVEVMEAWVDWQTDVFEADHVQAFTHFEDELADVVLCAMIAASREGVDLEGAILRGVERNVRRSEGRGDKV